MGSQSDTAESDTFNPEDVVEQLCPASWRHCALLGFSLEMLLIQEREVGCLPVHEASDEGVCASERDRQPSSGEDPSTHRDRTVSQGLVRSRALIMMIKLEIQLHGNTLNIHRQ